MILHYHAYFFHDTILTKYSDFFHFAHILVWMLSSTVAMLFINKLSEVLLKWTFELARKCVFVFFLVFVKHYLSFYNITLKLAKITSSIMIQPTKVRNTGVKGNV